MFLKIVLLLKNYMSERGKIIHFWKALCIGKNFSKFDLEIIIAVEFDSTDRFFISCVVQKIS